MNKKYVTFCAGILLGTMLTAQEKDSTAVQELDEVVVSDSRFTLKRENSGKTVIKITAEELERSQGRTVAEIINSKSGIEITGSRGRLGVNYGVFVRGGRGRQVLINIDGVRVSDPSSFSTEYDLRLLSSANIASIEIIKGAASTLYGTNAATAVINITTKKASGKKAAFDVMSSIGTNQTAENPTFNARNFVNNALLSGTVDKFSYSVGVSSTHADGMSALVTETNEEDPFSNTTVDAKLGYQFTKAFGLTVYGNQTKIKNEFDESSGLSDAPYTFNSEQKRMGLSSLYKYGKGSLTINGAISEYDNESISAFPNMFSSNNLVIDAFHKYNFNDKFYTVIGLNYLKDKADVNNDVEFTITDPYANVVYVSDFGLNLNAGVRFNNHSTYGSNFVYNFNPSFVFKTDGGYMKLLGSYAASYITPNLIQLFGAFGGNENLVPEDNRTIEGGFEYVVNKALRFNTLYFNRNEKNGFGFDPVTFGTINISEEIDASGIETEVAWQPASKIALSANYTFTERKGDNAIRIPKHKLNALLQYEFSEKTSGNVSFNHTGARTDTDFRTFNDVELEAFSLINMYLQHKVLKDKLNIFLAVDNIFNTEYQEIIGFSTRGINARMGFNLKL